jgi:hypothetical protein
MKSRTGKCEMKSRTGKMQIGTEIRKNEKSEAEK